MDFIKRFFRGIRTWYTGLPANTKPTCKYLAISAGTILALLIVAWFFGAPVSQWAHNSPFWGVVIVALLVPIFPLLPTYVSGTTTSKTGWIIGSAVFAFVFLLAFEMNTFEIKKETKKENPPASPTNPPPLADTQKQIDEANAKADAAEKKEAAMEAKFAELAKTAPEPVAMPYTIGFVGADGRAVSDEPKNSLLLQAELNRKDRMKALHEPTWLPISSAKGMQSRIVPLLPTGFKPEDMDSEKSWFHYDNAENQPRLIVHLYKWKDGKNVEVGQFPVVYPYGFMADASKLQPDGVSFESNEGDTEKNDGLGVWYYYNFKE